MAYSATDWRDRIAYFSGSTGNRSWGGMGQNQFQGKYYWNVNYASYFVVYADYTGCAGGSSPRPPEGGSVNREANTYIVAFCGGVFFYSFFTGVYTNTLSYAASNNSINLGNQASSFSGGYCSTYYLKQIGAISLVSPSAYYSYTPWGGPPYFAGSNIKIPSNATDAKPYQRQYATSVGC